jgi:unsaturated chondroitin disaccharide hydrolase
MIDLNVLHQQCASTVKFAETQLHRLVENHPDYFPMYTVEGKWRHEGAAWTNWCEGFLGGQLWLLYQATGDDAWRTKAEHYSRLVEPRKDDRTVHDLGFVFWSTWKRWYDLTGDPAINAVVVHAGKTMALRFKEKGRYLRSFVADESLFIDIMMNVGIIFYAAQQSGDADLLRVATEHCLTSRRVLVRGDGSAAHEGIFDLETGEFLRQSTHQGWRGDSAWARGLTWGLYGFGTAYCLSGDVRFLETAEALGDFYMQQTGAEGVPPNDWDEPSPAHPYESSAAAIAASGFLQLAEISGSAARRLLYQDYAHRILLTLTKPPFLATETPGWEGILKQGMYHERLGLGVNESVMWGDHFFLEAVCKVLGHERLTAV